MFFSLFCSPSLHLFDPKYSKNSNIIYYLYYYYYYLFIIIYICYLK